MPASPLATRSNILLFRSAGTSNLSQPSRPHLASDQIRLQPRRFHRHFLPCSPPHVVESNISFSTPPSIFSSLTHVCRCDLSSTPPPPLPFLHNFPCLSFTHPFFFPIPPRPLPPTHLTPSTLLFQETGLIALY